MSAWGVPDEIPDDDGDDGDERRGRDDAPHPPGVEAPDGQPTGARDIAQDQPRDEESGDDEIDVDSDESAAGDPPRMVQDDEQDCYRTQALDVTTGGSTW